MTPCVARTCLEAYTALRQRQDAEAAYYDRLEAAILATIPDEIRLALEEVAEARRVATVTTNEALDSATGRLKEAVVALGQSVKGPAFQAVYSPGRVTWDTKALEGVLLAYPALAALRQSGTPTVSLRAVVQKEAHHAVSE